LAHGVHIWGHESLKRRKEGIMTRKEWDALNNEGKKADLLKGCGDGYGQGHHEYAEKTCPKCGAVFCWNCCASTNVHQGGKHEPDYMLCPVCGHDYLGGVKQ